MLKDPALMILRQDPDVRHDGRVIIRKARVAVALRELIDDAVEVAFRSVSLVDCDSYALSEHLRRINNSRFKTGSFFFVQKFDLKGKKSRKTFGCRNAADQQIIISQWRCD